MAKARGPNWVALAIIAAYVYAVANMLREWIAPG